MRVQADVGTETRRAPLVPCLVALFAGFLALGTFFLVQPAFEAVPIPYYHFRFYRSPYSYIHPVLVLLVPYALALAAWRRGARLPLRWLVGGAVVLHLVLVFAPPPQSQDFYTYLFYGRMQAAHGGNPYVDEPIEFWKDPWFPWTRWYDQPSVYGPVWVGITGLVAALSGGSLTVAFLELKAVVLALDLAVVALVLAAARRRPDPQGAAGWGVLAYAWNPLVLLSVPLAGSADVALAAALVAAYLARRQDRPALATGLLTAGALVKAYGLVALGLHLVLLARERGWRRAAGHAAAAGGLGALAYWPYWAGLETFRGLERAAALSDNVTLTGVLQRAIRPVIAVLSPGSGHVAAEALVRGASLLALAAVAVWAVRRARDERSLWVGTLAVLLASLYLTQWFMYWYLVAPVALVAILPANRMTAPVLAFSGSALAWVHFSPRPLSWAVQVLVRYAPPLLALRASARRGRHRAPQRLAVAAARTSAGPAPAPARAPGRGAATG
jgi:hypothetical protein